MDGGKTKDRFWMGFLFLIDTFAYPRIDYRFVFEEAGAGFC